MNAIEWPAKSVRQLRKIADKPKRQLAHWTDCTGDIKRLQGREDYRLRVGDHRVIFEIDQDGTPVIVTIMQVEKRNERTY